MKEITIGFTPEPDDAFAYFALIKGRIRAPVDSIRFVLEPIESLNQRAARGELDIAAISSAYYPHLADQYDVLRSGASVGRGYGPALVTRTDGELHRVNRMRIAIPGETTTGAALLRLFFPGATTVAMPYEEIRDAIETRKVDAGVLIHEELLNYQEKSLRRLVCLGEMWTSQTGLPLPVGLNVVRRELGPDLCARLCGAVRDAMIYALQNRAEATDFAREFGRGPGSSVALKFIDMFANRDTVHFDEDCESGLAEFLRRLHEAGAVPRVPAIRYVEPAPTTSLRHLQKLLRA